ncbi:MAG: hypothetical protein QGF33_10280, partial [Alphaproteobacteria bacterium]|nr:hypothetical protein [Alphaproteobacteria bacterium]
MSTSTISNPVARWIDHRLPVFTFLNHELNEYPTPKNLSYWWNFGSLAGITLIIMIITGITLSMHYTAHVDHAFQSVERIMRDVNYGWLIRYVHMNGASFFFATVLSLSPPPGSGCRTMRPKCGRSHPRPLPYWKATQSFRP